MSHRTLRETPFQVHNDDTSTISLVPPMARPHYLHACDGHRDTRASVETADGIAGTICEMGLEARVRWQ